MIRLPNVIVLADLEVPTVAKPGQRDRTTEFAIAICHLVDTKCHKNTENPFPPKFSSFSPQNCEWHRNFKPKRTETQTCTYSLNRFTWWRFLFLNPSTQRRLIFCLFLLLQGCQFPLLSSWQTHNNKQIRFWINKITNNSVTPIPIPNMTLY